MTAALLACFFVTLLMGLPLVWVLILSAMVPGLMDPTFIGNVQFVMRGIIGGADSSSILAAPLFILSGVIMAMFSCWARVTKVFNCCRSIPASRRTDYPMIYKYIIIVSPCQQDSISRKK